MILTLEKLTDALVDAQWSYDYLHGMGDPRAEIYETIVTVLRATINGFPDELESTEVATFRPPPG